MDNLKERMRKLRPDKTRLIHFGRHAAKQREKLGEGKPGSASRTSARDHANGARSSSAQDDQETDASQAIGDQDRVAQDNARPRRENRRLGEGYRLI